MAQPSQPATQLPTISPVSHGSFRILHAVRDGWPLLVYVVASLATKAYFTGDTRDYADSIAARAIGRDYYFWEFGHIIWRPLGYVVFKISEPLTAYFVGNDTLIQATLVLMALSWLAGLLSVIGVYWLLNRVCHKKWVVNASTIGFVFWLAFLNYVHSGAPYIPGLSFVILALCILNGGKQDETISLRRSILGAFAVAGAVCVWFPYVVVSPAVVLSTGFLRGFNKQRLVVAIRTLIVAGVLTLSVYVLVAWQIGIDSPGEFKAWVALASGGAASTPNSGITKTIFGFARAFVSMGNDGMLFKRYLLKDPFNPVSFFDLVKSSFWKLAAFYLFVAAILLSLLITSRGRRMLALLAVAGIPVLAFAVYWQGGDPERYLSLFPFLVLGVGVSLDERPRPILKYVILIFLASAAALNVSVLATPRLNRQQQSSSARVSAVIPNLRPGSVIITANWQDDLVNFNRTFPFDPINRNRNLHIGSVITPGRSEATVWRDDFLKSTEAVWQRGGDVWLSKRLFAASPKSEWNWVEGDTPDISWTHLHSMFSQLETGESIGGEDGFVLLLPSERNREIIARAANAAKR